VRVACRCRAVNVPETILRRIFVMEDGCHYWLGGTSPKGYGKVTLNRKPWRVHRLMWFLIGKDLPDYAPGGLQMDHLCLNTSCCNPAHLQLVDQSTNMKRAADQRTHCAKGHELTDDNTRTHRGYRECKICVAASLHPRTRPTACPSGHSYSGENLYIRPDGQQVCRECARRANREWRERQKGN
jgi:hypothetical protein